MASWCVMVQGPCRGRNCDFWARVKLRKSTIGELVQQGISEIAQCDDSQQSIDSAIDCYWRSFGFNDMQRLQTEEPELFEKVREASAKLEERLKSSIE